MTIILRSLWIISFLGLSPLIATSASADDWSTFSIGSNVTVYYRGWSGDSDALRSSWSETLAQLSNQSILTANLPKDWGILLDGQWTASAGYFSPQLKTAGGLPAILLQGAAANSPDRGASLMAHELTHLAHSRLRPTEQSWVREGLAMMAEWRLSGKFSPVIKQAFIEPETSLTSELDPTDQSYQDQGKTAATYGHILQYFYFLDRLCGGNPLLDEFLTSSSSENGVTFVDAILRRRSAAQALSPVCANFQASFRFFELARFKQNPARSEEHVLASTWKATIRDLPSALPPYSAMAYRQTPGVACPTDDTSLGNSACFHIRFE